MRSPASSARSSLLAIRQPEYTAGDGTRQRKPRPGSLLPESPRSACRFRWVEMTHLVDECAGDHEAEIRFSSTSLWRKKRREEDLPPGFARHPAVPARRKT